MSQMDENQTSQGNLTEQYDEAVDRCNELSYGISCLKARINKLESLLSQASEGKKFFNDIKKYLLGEFLYSLLICLGLSFAISLNRVLITTNSVLTFSIVKYSIICSIICSAITLAITMIMVGVPIYFILTSKVRHLSKNKEAMKINKSLLEFCKEKLKEMQLELVKTQDKRTELYKTLMAEEKANSINFIGYTANKPPIDTEEKAREYGGRQHTLRNR